jgi:hypothetical protein
MNLSFFITQNYKIVAEVKAFPITNSQVTCFQSLRIRHISIVEGTIAGYSQAELSNGNNEESIFFYLEAVIQSFNVSLHN